VGESSSRPEETENEELHNMKCSLHIIRVIIWWRMLWVGHLACMREIRNAYILNGWEDTTEIDLK
jgi:hypothetical protein